jgi:hypothetical protein
MASLAYFRKLGEDGSTVSYEFGPERDRMTRTVSFDKVTQEATLGGPYEDALSRGTAVTIYRRFKQQGAWPETGVHAS